MGKVFTPEEAAAALFRWDSRKDGLIIEGMTNVLNYAAKLAAQKYQVGGTSRDAFIDPPNPPPGPLKIRSGRLRRGIKVVEPKKKGNNYIGGLSNKVPYAAIHEFGGKTKAHAIVAKNAETLAFFSFKTGEMVFRFMVWHPGSNIPARPSLTPAIQDAEKERGQELIGKALIHGARDLGLV